MSYPTPYNIDMGNWTTDQIGKFMAMVRKLPPAIKTLLLSSDSADFIEEKMETSIGQKQKGDLARIIRDILTADLFIGDMTSEIGKRLNVDQNTAQQIRDRIISELFAPAIEDIKKVQREKFANPNKPVAKQGSARPQTPPTPASTAQTDVNPNNVVNLRDK